MVALDPVVGVAVGAVPGGWHQLLQHRRAHRRLIACDLDGRDLGHADRPLKESASCREIPSPGDEDVDDLPELVSRAVHRAPLTRDLHIGLVHLPEVTDGVSARSGGVDQQRREPLHPPVDRDVVDLDAALGEEFLDVAVGQAEAQVQRTASTITSAGKRKPAKADRVAGARRGRRVLIPTVSLLGRSRRRCNSASQSRTQRLERILLCDLLD
jgi:hypothetical protein